MTHEDLHKIREGETVEQATERIKKHYAEADKCKTCDGSAYGSAYSVFNPKTKKFDKICTSCARKR